MFRAPSRVAAYTSMYSVISRAAVGQSKKICGGDDDDVSGCGGNKTTVKRRRTLSPRKMACAMDRSFHVASGRAVAMRWSAAFRLQSNVTPPRNMTMRHAAMLGLV